MRALGALFFVAGFASLVYFFFSFTTSTPVNSVVPTATGSTVAQVGQITNEALENERVCGCISGAALLITGAVFLIGGEIKNALTGNGAFTPLGGTGTPKTGTAEG